ncbi:MAG TPA: c-type cytochrome [Terriglobia bacterium]|nr:c-type cytochrome [Terriglobia bacterium]
MKLVRGKTTLWCVLTLLSAVIVVGQGGGQRGGGQQQGGAAILERACGSCHAADVIGNYHYESAEGYREVVNTMIDAGARVTPQELPVLVDYLFATYGKKQQPGAAPVAATDPGKALLESACTSCHGLETMANHVYDSRAQYESLIGNMIGYGAIVTPAQIPVLADYMLKTYGKKPADAQSAPPASAAAADPGKAILEKACTTCHGLEGLPNHAYTSKEPYADLVKSMVAYGAVVPDAQLPALIDYMFKTYGKK